MSKETQKDRKRQLDGCLRTALKTYHASSLITQEELANRLDISLRACSALEGGQYGFSAFTAFALFSLLPLQERLPLLEKICSIYHMPSSKIA